MMGYEPEETSMSFAQKLVPVTIVVTCAACVRKPVTAPRAVVPETTPSLSFTCLEERFAFSVPLIAHMDLGALVADAPVLGKMRRDLRSFGWARRSSASSSPAWAGTSCSPSCPWFGFS